MAKGKLSLICRHHHHYSYHCYTTTTTTTTTTTNHRKTREHHPMKSTLGIEPTTTVHPPSSSSPSYPHSSSTPPSHSGNGEQHGHSWGLEGSAAFTTSSTLNNSTGTSHKGTTPSNTAATDNNNLSATPSDPLPPPPSSTFLMTTNVPPQIVTLAKERKVRGNSYFINRQYPEALIEYNAAINIYSHPRTNDAHAVASDPEEAKTLRDQTSLEHSVPSSLYSNRALVHIKLKQYANAVDDCTLALWSDPHNYKAIWHRADAYFHLAQYREARFDLESLASLPKSSISPHSRLECVQKLCDIETWVHIHEESSQAASESNPFYLHMKILVNEWITELSTKLDISSFRLNDAVALGSAGIALKVAVSGGQGATLFRKVHGFQLSFPFLPQFPEPVLKIWVAVLECGATGDAPSSASSTASKLGTGQASCEQTPMADAYNEFVVLGFSESILEYAKHTPSFFALLKCKIFFERLFRNSKMVLFRHLMHVLRQSISALAPASPSTVLPNLAFVVRRITEYYADTLIPVDIFRYIIPLLHSVPSMIVPLLKRWTECTLKSHLDAVADVLLPELWIIASPFLTGSHSSQDSDGFLVTSKDALNLIYTVVNSLTRPIPTFLAPTDASGGSSVVSILYSTRTPLSFSILKKLLRYNHHHVISHPIWTPRVLMDLMLTNCKPSALRLIFAYLYQSPQRIMEWERWGGHRFLVEQLVNEKSETLIGTIVACIAECAQAEAARKELVRIDAIAPLVGVLRTASSTGGHGELCRNLTIAISRLAKDADGLARLGEIGGMELLYSSGHKMRSPMRFNAANLRGTKSIGV